MINKFAASIISKIYQIDAWQEEEMFKRRTDNPKNRQSQLRLDSENNYNDNQANNFPTKSELFHRKAWNEINVLCKEPNDNPELKYNVLSKLSYSIKSRKAFKYTYLDILHFFLCWAYWRSKKTMRTHKSFRNHLYYKIGEEKLYNELDWISLIKTIRHQKILTRLLLSKYQELLIKFQRNNVIDSSSSGTSDEGNANIVKFMTSKDNKDKEKAQDKIKSSIYWYRKSQISEVDLRIMKGVVVKRFNEDEDSEYYAESEESFSNNQRAEFIQNNLSPVNKVGNRYQQSVELLMKNIKNEDANHINPNLISNIPSK